MILEKVNCSSTVSAQGPGTQKHLSSTYLSAVHIKAVKTT